MSPQTAANSKYAGEANLFDFTIVADPDNAIARTYGIAFELPEEISALHARFGFDLHIENESERAELPLAATYVIDSDGKEGEKGRAKKGSNVERAKKGSNVENRILRYSP